MNKAQPRGTLLAFAPCLSGSAPEYRPTNLTLKITQEISCHTESHDHKRKRHAEINVGAANVVYNYGTCMC